MVDVRLTVSLVFVSYLAGYLVRSLRSKAMVRASITDAQFWREQYDSLRKHHETLFRGLYGIADEAVPTSAQRSSVRIKAARAKDSLGYEPPKAS